MGAIMTEEQAQGAQVGVHAESATLVMEAVPAVAPVQPVSFLVDLPAYAGPLDLLLSLIRDEKVDIYDIPIAHIARQFLLRVRVLQLNDAAEYLELAARLLRIKAQMLLPRADGEETTTAARAGV